MPAGQSSITPDSTENVLTTYQLLELVRRRTAMYTGEASVHSLGSFVAGYAFCQWQAGITVEEETPDFGGFHNWVANKLGFSESTSGWRNMITNQRLDAEEALWLFFQLLDEYRGLHPRILANVAHEELENILQPSKGIRPAYTSLTIEEVLPAKEWVVLIAKRHDVILYQRSADSVEKAIQEAKDVFGVALDAWVLTAN
jgi:hypothetical protein